MVAIGRIAKSVSRIVFDPKWQETATKALDTSRRSVGYTGLRYNHFKDAFVKADKATINTKLWDSMKNSMTTLPQDMKTMWKSTNGAWAKTKGVFSQLGKRMPVIGGLLMIGFELPNLISAFSDKGIIGGLFETAKSSSRLVGSMAGMAIGQALIPIPFLGGLIGGIAGDWLVSKVVGKSHSEQKAEALEGADSAEKQYEELQKQLKEYQMNTPYGNTNSVAQNQFATPTMTPQQIQMLGQQLYGTGSMNDDFMANMSGINNLGKLNYTC